MIAAITRIDFAILDFIQNNIKTEFLDTAMCFITSLGDGGILWIALGLFMVFTKKYRRCGFSVLLVLILCLVLGNMLLKPLFARVRPCQINYNIEMLISAPHGYSFPSGHTLAAFSTAFIVLLNRVKKPGIVLLVLSCLIGFSRIYLYVHYPTDVLGGIFFAAVFSGAVYFGFKKCSNNFKVFL